MGLANLNPIVRHQLEVHLPPLSHLLGTHDYCTQRIDKPVVIRNQNRDALQVLRVDRFDELKRHVNRCHARHPRILPASAQRAGVKLRRTINNAAGERSEPAASEASAASFNSSLDRRSNTSDGAEMRVAKRAGELEAEAERAIHPNVREPDHAEGPKAGPSGAICEYRQERRRDVRVNGVVSGSTEPRTDEIR
jgi:hypothetical protein